MASDTLTLAAQCTAPTRDATEAEKLAGALRRVSDGDRDAFEDVYRRTSAKLFGVCLRILPIRAEAEDVLQDVYCAVWRRAGSFDAARGSAMTWLITMTRNRAVDQLRRSRHGRAVPVEWASAVADPLPLAFEIVAAHDDHRKMQDCLALLSARDASALKMAFFGGSTYADLAHSACIPIGTMKSRMRRALLELRDGMA